ncbi:MAG: 2-hydroxyacid dehydrogenase [Pseudomonadota bacterium]
MTIDVLMTVPFQPSCEEALDRTYTLHRLWQQADAQDFLERSGRGIRAVATDGAFGCPAWVMDLLPDLEIIGNFGVGYDSVDIPAAKDRGIVVTNTPDVLNDAVAEMAIGLMLALGRQIATADRFIRAGRWLEGNHPLTREFRGSTVGIVGLGRIGKEIAVRANAMKATVVYHGRSQQPGVPYRYFADLAAMAAECDWLVVAVPGGVGTQGLVSRDVLAALGPDGMVVNVARGSVVDQHALVELLQSGALAGAALDVFADEPNVPPDLFGMDHVVMSPHIASATHRTRWEMGDLVVRNLAAHFAGESLLTPVT